MCEGFCYCCCCVVVFCVSVYCRCSCWCSNCSTLGQRVAIWTIACVLLVIPWVPDSAPAFWCVLGCSSRTFPASCLKSAVSLRSPGAVQGPVVFPEPAIWALGVIIAIELVVASCFYKNGVRNTDKKKKNPTSVPLILRLFFMLKI